MKQLVEAMQKLGRALMLPIAVLPIAGMLLRIGQPDLLDIAFISSAGAAIFDHLGLLFAVGVATGFARDGNGAAALAGVTAYLISTVGAQTFLVPPTEIGAGLADKVAALAVHAWKDEQITRLQVPIGIISGLIGGNFYNWFSGIKLPEYLAFFGGRRFVPIASGFAGLAVAAVIGLGYGGISAAVDTASQSIVASGGFGLFVYGTLNRLLIVTGLHHIINNVAWFVVGDYHGATGDIRRFFAGDPSAGGFMSGFFPVMMFGLPAACLAMYHEARPDRRKAVGGMLLSLGLTSLLTGVTEPIEFTFMFIAPALYAIHAVLTGLAMALMNLLGVKLGFGFSAGLFDYVLNFRLATKPWMLLPVGLVYALVYYGLFRFFIRRFNLQTPGREVNAVGQAVKVQAGTERGLAFLRALGGEANLTSVDACTTRLRLVVVDQAAIDEARLAALGSRGIVRPSANAAQIVLGPVADMVASEIRESMTDAPQTAVQVADGPQAVGNQPSAALPAELATLLGGAANVSSFRALQDRYRVEVRDPADVDLGLLSTETRGVTWAGANVLHVLRA